MKSLPVVEGDFKKLYSMLSDSIRANLLFTAIELKVFNYLNEPGSANDVAQAIDTHLENTRLFLDGLTACEFLVKKDGMYQNTSIVQEFLVEGSPVYLGEFLNLNGRLGCPSVSDLSRMVKEGPHSVSSSEDWDDEETWAKQALILANYQRAGTARKMADIIAGLPEFPSFQKMLDLGGGPGLIGISIVAGHPTMKGVIFDQPAVVKVSERFIKEYEMEDRMEVMAGDYINGSIGENYDLILASATLNFARHDIDTVMKKIYDALNPGGLCVVLTDGLTHERTRPESMVLGWLTIAMMGQEMSLEQGFISDSMLRVGFKSVRNRTVDWPMGIMDLEIARK